VPQFTLKVRMMFSTKISTTRCELHPEGCVASAALGLTSTGWGRGKVPLGLTLVYVPHQQVMRNCHHNTYIGRLFVFVYPGTLSKVKGC